MAQALFQLWLLQALAADLIVIESNALDAELARVTIASCNEARGADACRSELEPSAEPGWFARVFWQDAAQLSARIEIRRAAPDAVPESVRVVAFSAADELAQRHRAIGLIVASYVAERERRAQPVAVPSAGARPSTPAPRWPRAGIDLALLAGTALDHGAPRFGLTLRAFVRPFHAPLAVTLALRGARRFGEVDLLFGSGSAGALLRLDAAGRPLALELRGELIAERVHAGAEDPASGAQDTDGRWRLGGQLGLEAHIALGNGFSAFAGGDAHLLLPAVTVEVGGREIGRMQALGAAGLLGVRFAH